MVGAASVAAGIGGDAGESGIVGAEFEPAEAAVFVGEGAAKKLHDLFFGKLIECVDTAAREKCGDDFEGRVLSGRADEADVASFDVGKKGILLSLVEAMNFVDEDDGA